MTDRAHFDPKQIKVSDIDIKWQGNYIQGGLVYYRYPGWKEDRDYEVLERTTHKDRVVDGVEIYPIIKYKDGPSKLVLIKNFRVPVGKMCIEVPAGLVDENESVESAAVRELKEETGYDGKITKIMPVSQIDQWKSRENTQLVFMEIDGDLEVNKNPKPNLEETEYIEVFLVSLDDPFPIIDKLMKEEGYLISTHLQAFLVGLNMKLQ